MLLRQHTGSGGAMFEAGDEPSRWRPGLRGTALSRLRCLTAERRGYWKAVVAIAAKNARMAWAVLTKGESFKLPA